MADVIKECDIERLVSCAIRLIKQSQYSPIEIIKQVKEKEKCSLAEAKEAYLLTTKGETLGEYQESVILPLLRELEESEKRQ